METSPDDDRFIATRVTMLPKDTNARGTIFGGVILSHIDLAAAVEARRHTRHKVVTVAMNAVEFHEPVHVGDVVTCYTRLVRRGRTSLTIHVEVEARRDRDLSEVVKVTEAHVVYVAVGEDGVKVPLDAG